jgi:taurine dioxygenase
MPQKEFSPDDALKQPRQVGIRLHIDHAIGDLPAEDVRLLLELLTQHGVLCLVDQPPIEPRQLHDFASRWGEVIELTSGLALANQEPGVPSITRVGNVRPDGSIIAGAQFAEYWHHDGDFWAPGSNFVVNFLSAVRVPPTGGRTGFLDSRLAYDRLDDSQRAALADAYICVRASEISDFEKAAPHELPPDVNHPVLLPHPVTGEIALYLPDSSTGIQTGDGQPLGPVRDWVDALQDKLGIVEHGWSEGDLLITDNLQVLHRSMGGYGDNPRLLYRCQARVTAGNR